jgi:diguanylate cyclase (GGDEF)-like protein
MAILEPSVEKIAKLTGVEKPLIFHSKFAESESKAQKLETEKKQLENRLATTEFHLQETMEKLVKDPLTHYFNEMFLQRHLGERIMSAIFPLSKETDLVLFFIQIDNILSINSRFSKKTGDETIRNLGYLLEQHLGKNDLLIKRNGPGFIIFVENLAERDPSSFAQKIQNAVKEAETFIEPVTLSIAIVTLSEFTAPFEKNTLSEKRMDLGENRIKAASKGKGMIVDQKTKIVQGKTGRLLIADHEEINLHLLESLFFNENFDVSLAKDGLTALKLAEEISFDAIIVERTISKLDGMLLKQRINQNLLNDKTPYILLTFNKNAEIISRANLLGIDFVIQKPIIFEEMTGIVHRLMKKGGSK